MPARRATGGALRARAGAGAIKSRCGRPDEDAVSADDAPGKQRCGHGDRHAPIAVEVSRGGGRHGNDGQRGAALLLVVMLAAAAAASSASLLARAGAVAREVHAREQALCARYAALSGLAFDAAIADASAAAALVADQVDSLTTALVRRGPSWCVLRATARCGQATRTLERTLDDPARCN